MDNIHKLLKWATGYSDHVVFLNSNQLGSDPYGRYDAILAVGRNDYYVSDNGSDHFHGLKDFTVRHDDWIFGFLSYDLKNQLEDLCSENEDKIGMPLMNFFVPEFLIMWDKGVCKLGVIDTERNIDLNSKTILNYISSSVVEKNQTAKANVKQRVGRTEYINTVRQLKNYIRRGDIYEVNYCIEFFAENAEIDPVSTYCRLNAMSPAPFSTFCRFENKYLLSSSPERFLAKRGSTIISQPIKGTIGRGADAIEDQRLKLQLLNSPKERSENVMIVDLVRNDLARSAVTGTVKVEELFGIYTYERVHQMISTISAQLDPRFNFIDVLKESFPMGSMTGAPKVRAMQLIEEFEDTKRGLYSGALGYISPERDFDFNVIIRSILYNKEKKYLSFMAGSAITYDSDPLCEYEECLLKAQAMRLVLQEIND